MLVVVSPAKKLNMNPINNLKETEPFFSKNANELISVVKKLSSDNLKELMGISPQLAELNKQRFMDFGKQDKKAAAFAFAGDTYKGLDIEKMNQIDLEWAQEHLRILSGLYGLLRPLDSIEPYRLEMGTKISIGSNNDLYSFWKKKVTEQLKDELKKDELVVNLASREYFSVIDSDLISNTIVSPEFKDFKDGKLKIISFFAKKARGMMARYLIEQNTSSLEDIRSFSKDGYYYSEEETKNMMCPVFIR